MADSEFPPRIRRSSLKELRQTITRLKRKLRKEEKRAKQVQGLKKYIHELSAQIRGYQQDPDLQ